VEAPSGKQNIFGVMAIENHEFSKKKENNFWIRHVIIMNFQRGSSLNH